VQVAIEPPSAWGVWDFSGLDLLEASGEAALVLDRSATVMYCNAAAERLQRRPRSEIVGQSLGLVSSRESPVENDRDVWSGILAGEHWSGDVWVSRGDGTRVPVYVTRSPLFGPDQSVVGVLSLATDRTTEQEAKTALVASERRFRALFARSSDLAILFAPDGTMIYVSPSIEAVSGLHPDGLLGSSAWSYVHPADREELRDAVALRLKPDTPVTGEWRMITATGWRWFEMTLSDMTDDPAIGGIVGNLRDVTERREALEALRTLAERFRRVFDESPVGKMIVDTDLRVVEVNQALSESLGYPAGDLNGASIDSLVHPSEVNEQRSCWEALFGAEVDRFQVHLRYRRADGSEVVARVSASVLHDERGEAVSGICEVEDVTEQVRADEELARRALTDPLTHLPNRALLHDRLQQALARLTRESALVAVMFLDIDRFKLVNDALGHEAGDKLLVAVAARLAEAVRATDTVARFGGDEFVVIAEDVVDLPTVMAFGQRLVDAVAAPLKVDGCDVSPSVSIGVALTSDPGHSASGLVRDADLAMYRAKDAGGGRCELDDRSSGRPSSAAVEERPTPR
jgi:diguanylate cyclase (GGDEF)-like protein/PAS domain S-box-containing protein